MREIDREELATRFKNARLAAELSQGALAEEMPEALGIGQSFVSAIELQRAALGSEMNLERLEALATFLRAYGFEMPYKEVANGTAEPDAPAQGPEREFTQDGEYLIGAQPQLLPGTIVARHFGQVESIRPAQGLQYEMDVLRGFVVELEHMEEAPRKRLLTWLFDAYGFTRNG